MIDVLYDLNWKIGQFGTFLVAGIGDTDFGDDHDTVFDFGAGVKYELADNLVWRTALRSFNYLERGFGDNDFGIDSELIFYFGGSRSSGSGSASTRRPAAPAVAAAPTPAPTPTPAPDADQDGVPDSRDNCPDTPRNYAVDTSGCPIPIEEVARIELLVNFDFDGSEVRAEYFSEIEEVADFLRQYPDVIAELEGHTDGRGTDVYNQGLSERRANAVRNVLINQFNVQGSRVSAQGFGESQPVASNNTDSGRAQNRRVITVILKTLQNYQPR